MKHSAVNIVKHIKNTAVKEVQNFDIEYYIFGPGDSGN